VTYLAKLYVYVTTCFQIFRTYVQNIHIGINDQLINITALIHGLDVF